MKTYAAKTPPHLITLIILTSTSVLAMNMFLPSLTNMAAEFSVSYSVMNISVAGYLAITAILQVILGPLSDRFGRRPVLLGSILIFSLASLFCALSSNIWIFLSLRILQGAIISGMTLSRAIVRDIMDPKDAVRVLGTIAMAMAVAPMLGPVLGGVFDEVFGWRAIFWFYLGLGLVLFVLTWADLGETNKNTSATFQKQFSTYPDLLRSGLFWGYSICLSFGIACFYAFLSGAPLVADKVLNLPPSHLGFYMGSITGAFLVGSFISNRLAKQTTSTKLVLAGRTISVLGLSLGLIIVMFGNVSSLSIFGSTLFIGLGNGMSLPSCYVGVMNVRSDLAGSAAGLSGAMGVAAGAILATMMAAILTENNAAFGFLSFLLVAKIISLAGAILAHNLERKIN
ncbi:MAG: multidrug effflux MFS transporter [Rhodobacteraceae bacterium]|nr:multidrug effflux MFS transporter [Paracoccaceae bacterium]